MFSEIHCIIRGRVQRVGYRDFLTRYAEERGFVGWIKNNEDGSVEALLQGYPDDLKICIEQLYQGPSLARVDDVVVDWRTPEKQLDEFKVIA